MSRALTSKPIKVAEKPEKSAKLAVAARKKPVGALGQAKPAKEGKKAKQKTPEPLRECFFTFPEADYARISELKTRALGAGRKVKKSELLRAGLALLAGLTDAAFLKALEGLGKTRAE